MSSVQLQNGLINHDSLGVSVQPPCMSSAETCLTCDDSQLEFLSMCADSGLLCACTSYMTSQAVLPSIPCSTLSCRSKGSQLLRQPLWRSQGLLQLPLCPEPARYSPALPSAQPYHDVLSCLQPLFCSERRFVMSSLSTPPTNQLLLTNDSTTNGCNWQEGILGGLCDCTQLGRCCSFIAQETLAILAVHALSCALPTCCF